MPQKKAPAWESELWSRVSTGDGMHCPLLRDCEFRKRGGWCPDIDKDYVTRLVDNNRADFRRYDSISSRTCGRIFQLVEMLAEEYLKRGRVTCPPVPIGLVSLADEQHPIEVHALPLKTHHGAIWRVRDRWVIQLKEADTPARKRFALFHEVFHILAHCRTSPVFRKRQVEQGSFNELLAD